MNINSAYPSAYLKSDELQGDTTFTIREVTIETLGQGKDAEEKPIIYFNEVDKGLACNKTNANTIAGLYGPETDDWIGKPITLFATEVEFQGKMTLAIRVRMRKPVAAAPTQAAAPATAPVVQPVAGSKDSTFAAYKEKVDRYVTDEGGTGYSNGDLQQVFRNVMRDLFPGKTAAQLSSTDWARAQDEIEHNFDPATKALLPF